MPSIRTSKTGNIMGFNFFILLSFA